MNNLPIWNYPGTAPAFNETESFTAIEATAKVYAAMRELISEYNKFSEAVTEEVKAFENGETTAREEFEKRIVCLVGEYTRAIDEKINSQDSAVAAMVNELPEIAKTVVNEAIAAGKVLEDAVARASIADLETEQAVLNARMNTFTSLQEGEGTAENAELLDIRVGSDGFIYDSAGEAVREQFGDVNNVFMLSDLMAWKEIIDSSKIRDGYYASDTNTKEFIQDTAWRSIELNCKGKLMYKISAGTLSGACCLAIFYDATGKKIYNTDVPTNTEYVEDFIVKVPHGAETMVIVSRWHETGRLPKYSVFEGVNSELLRQQKAKAVKLNTKAKNGYYPQDVGTKTFILDDGWRSIDIDVENLGFVYLSGKTLEGACALAAFWDENGSHVWNIGVPKNTEIVTDLYVTIPLNAKTMTVTSYQIDPTIRGVMNCAKPLNGKRLMVFGDSIAAVGYRWRERFLERTGMREIACYANGGAHLADYNDTDRTTDYKTELRNNVVTNQVYAMMQDPPTEEPDVIIVHAMTNDFPTPEEYAADTNVWWNFDNNTVIPLDTIDLTTIEGAMRWIYENILSVYPDAQVFFTSPIQMNWIDCNYSDSIKKEKKMERVCNAMSVPLIKCATESGIYGRFENYQASGKYLEDGVHPNADGGNKLGSYIASEVVKYMTGNC